LWHEGSAKGNNQTAQAPKLNSTKHRATADASHNNVGDLEEIRESHLIASERFCPKDLTDAGGCAKHSHTTYRMPSLLLELYRWVYNIPTPHEKT